MEASMSNADFLHLLGIEQLNAAQIMSILDRAAHYECLLDHDAPRLGKELAGRTVALLFYENSTRTRCSFELAAKYLGAHTTQLTASGSSVQKGESLLDTVRTLDQMYCDYVVIRHSRSGVPHYLAAQEDLQLSILNAGDGMHEHPTQTLLDLYTMYRHFGHLEGLKVVIVGDILHSRVARSHLLALPMLGAQLTFVGPSTLLPRGLKNKHVSFEQDLTRACQDAHVIMTLRLQAERQRHAYIPSLGEYARFYGLKEELLEKAAPNAIFMHPGPTNHEVEMPGALLMHPQSRVHPQVKKGLLVRMAVLSLIEEARRNRAAEMAR